MVKTKSRTVRTGDGIGEGKLTVMLHFLNQLAKSKGVHLPLSVYFHTNIIHILWLLFNF